MSYDIHVIAKRQPKAAHLEACLAALPAPPPTANGRLKRSGQLVLTDESAGVQVEVDGPDRIEADDVPGAAVGGIGRSGWLVQLSIKPSTDAAWPQELAVHLARAADGVVYDPQLDRVTWPAGFRPPDPGTGEERISEVELDWYVPHQAPDPSVPHRLLELLRKHAPEAVPRRYGGYEPLPFRFEGDRADEEYIERWMEEATGWSPMMFWTGARPCFGGSAFMSTLLDPERPRPGRPIAHVSLTFDGRAIVRDPGLADRFVELLTAVAERLGCIYAAGSVNRDAIAKRGRISADARTETSAMPRADRWMGLPAAPTWLAWFGRPYRDLVKDSVAEHVTSETNGGLLLRMGREPMDADALADRFPPLPTDLLARRTDQPVRWEPKIRYTLVDGPPSEPAAEIPELG